MGGDNDLKTTGINLSLTEGVLKPMIEPMPFKWYIYKPNNGSYDVKSNDAKSMDVKKIEIPKKKCNCQVCGPSCPPKGGGLTPKECTCHLPYLHKSFRFGTNKTHFH